MERRRAEIIARMQKVDEEQAAIERAAKLENDDGVFTEDQASQYKALASVYDNLLKEKNAIDSQISLIEQRRDRADDMSVLTPRRSASNSGSVLPAGAGLPGTAIGGSHEPEQHRPFRIPANVRRNGQPKNFKGEVDGLKAEERAYRFGQWVLARVSQDMPGRYSFPSATQFVENYLPTNTAHGSNDSVTGGHVLVPEEFSSDLILLREKYGVARRLFGVTTMSSDVKHEPRQATGLTAYFVGQNAAGTESNVTWEDVQLVAKDLMAIARMSNQLSADAVISIGDKLAGDIAYAFALKEDQCAFNGDGTATYGGIRGVRHLLQNLDAAGTDSAGLKVQGSGSTWGAQVLADFHAVLGKLPQYADNDNTCWVCHKTYYSEVMQKLELAAGGVTAREMMEGDRRPRPMFLGYPVEFSQVFPAATATTGVTAVLGDFNLGALFGDRQQTSIAFSEHATIGGESVFERNQVAVRGTERFDINVHGVGDASTPGPIVGLATG